MREEPEFRLHSVSVVVTAQFHNPSILNRDFLVAQAVVPESWEVAEAVTTPAVSFVNYRNGIQLTLDERKLSLVEACKSSFQEEYRVYKIVNDYLTRLPHVPYRSLGLNYRVSMRQENPQDWLIQRFMKPGDWSRGEPIVRSMAPRFAIKAGDDAECFFTFTHGQVRIGQNENGTAVLADCNVHHAGPLDASGQQAAIARWPERQRFVIKALNIFLRSPHSDPIHAY